MSESSSAKGPVAVVKIGGSILTSARAYRRAAISPATPSESRQTNGWWLWYWGRREPPIRSSKAQAIVAEPARAALDLLWSTGEIRSVALLAMHLQAIGVAAAALNIHEAGLTIPDAGHEAGRIRLHAGRLCGVLAKYSIAVVPGFLATDSAHAIVSLGRGGSDLTAVLLAEGLRACRCELIKDVPGYFTADPHRDPTATHIPQLSFAQALEFAADGCDLVQRKAIEAASRSGLPLVIRSVSKKGHVSRISNHEIMSASVETASTEAIAS